MKNYLIIIITSCLLVSAAFAEKPNRVGTTAANFLEIGYGSTGNAMGDAAVASCSDLSAIFWNPGRLAYMKQSEAQFMYQPWIADINTSFTAASYVHPRLGVFALSFFQTDFGEMDVTTLEWQDGTGEQFSAQDFCAGLSYARKLAQWFSFGANFKYIHSKIWHTNASAMALDLGMVVNTYFFSPSGRREDGLTIGMSISNYGTKMQYDGMDLMQPIDLYPDQNGNYAYAEGQFRTQAWELPLLFRIGAALYPISTAKHKLTLEVDALHPNNNSESVNLGAQYDYNLPSFGTFTLRAGYKALFMVDSHYGASFGAGLKYNMMNNLAVRVDYAFRDIGMLGKMHAYSFSILY